MLEELRNELITIIKNLNNVAVLKLLISIAKGGK